MKLAYAAEIPFVKKTRGLSPEEYQQRIIAKLEPAFVFGGFILPWKGNHTYFRIYNLDTQEYKDYKLRKLEDTNGGELFQTEKAVWLKMESRCNEKGKKFLGWWICPYISRHLLSLNPLLACCRRYSRGER